MSEKYIRPITKKMLRTHPVLCNSYPDYIQDVGNEYSIDIENVDAKEGRSLVITHKLGSGHILLPLLHERKFTLGVILNHQGSSFADIRPCSLEDGNSSSIFKQHLDILPIDNDRSVMVVQVMGYIACSGKEVPLTALDHNGSLKKSVIERWYKQKDRIVLPPHAWLAFSEAKDHLLGEGETQGIFQYSESTEYEGTQFNVSLQADEDYFLISCSKDAAKHLGKTLELEEGTKLLGTGSGIFVASVAKAIGIMAGNQESGELSEVEQRLRTLIRHGLGNNEWEPTLESALIDASTWLTVGSKGAE